MVLTLASKITLALVLAKGAAEIGLEQINRRYLLAHGKCIPERWRDRLEETTRQKSAEYTLAKSRLSQIESVWDTLILAVALFSGVLPWLDRVFTTRWGESALVESFFVLSALALVSTLDWPFEWYAQFHLEQRFGFNTTTPATWWLDRAKGLLLFGALGIPFLWLLVKWVEWAKSSWWLWGWLSFVLLETVLMIIGPTLILPLFNRFTPLCEGELRQRLFALARKTGFQTRQIEIMDGSRRSRHANAFFAGLGRARKIVLFDTLLHQLGSSEVEAVLAHEIGHYKNAHVLKLVALSAAGALAGFFLLFWLSQRPWFYQAFGFANDRIGPAFLVFAWLGGTIGFWLAPLKNFWSRRYEYEADAFAARALKESDSLRSGLFKLHEKNLSNLWPHPFYSAFYYSHPTLAERDRALEKLGMDLAADGLPLPPNPRR